MDTGKIILGAVFLLIAAYIFIGVDSSAAKIFGGGVLTVLGVVTIIRAYARGDKKPAPASGLAAPEPAAPAPEPAAPAPEPAPEPAPPEPEPAPEPAQPEPEPEPEPVEPEPETPAA